MSKPIGYTFAIATRNPKQTFVFCKWLGGVQKAIDFAMQELKDRSQYDVEYILIRDGVVNADDPIIWDSRTAPKTEVNIWTHTPVPAGFPLVEVNARFEKRAASVLVYHEGTVDFSTWQPHEKEGFCDYRYKKLTIRAAWMMYLDLALEHFDRFGAVV
jgi:hypothetical protein